MKKILIMVFTLLSSLILMQPVEALNSAVYFEGGAENFVFYPGTEWADVDLFDGFKDAMPGDTFTEEIKVRNTAPEYDSVKLYLRADPHNDENPLSEPVSEIETISSMQDFLSQLSMKVWNRGELIYDASPDQLDGLSENVFLGTFLNGASTTIKVELTIPITLGNEYMHRAGEVDWVFTAEGYNDDIVEPDQPDNPGPSEEPTPSNSKTLDNIREYGWLFIVSLIGLISSALIIRRLIKKEA